MDNMAARRRTDRLAFDSAVYMFTRCDTGMTHAQARSCLKEALAVARSWRCDLLQDEEEDESNSDCEEGEGHDVVKEPNADVPNHKATAQEL